MVMNDTIKVEVKLPENLKKAVTKVCNKFNDDPNDFIIRAVKGDLEAAIGEQFGSYIKAREVPIMIEVETAVYLEWWYKVAKARIAYGSLSEFLKSATRKYMERNNYLDTITEEEAQELDQMKEEAGIPTLEAFTLEIEKILKGEP